MKSAITLIGPAPFNKTEEQYQRFRVGFEAYGLFEPGLLVAVGIG